MTKTDDAPAPMTDDDLLAAALGSVEDMAMINASLAETITRLQAEVERLRAMVRHAYNDGFGEGMREHTTHKGGTPWNLSKWPARLSQPPSQEKSDERDPFGPPVGKEEI